MATGAILGQGTLLKQCSTANGSYTSPTTIGEVTDINGLSLSTTQEEATSHDSANASREFIQGLLDAGEITFTINYKPSNATHKYAAGGFLYDLATRQGLRDYTLTFPGIGAWQFQGNPQAFSPKASAQGGILSADCTIKASGFPVLV